ncbi:PASTA domain-containing protein [Lewinella sp. W8]|uniref:PASTA domain-containing protein n=1 Tax=Lewinella sp. W8 TaxID=2528208 RepID=UPI0010687D59|nr:PASTA domain-containing protein [Lewinella sp. W8]MTB53589.1 PASTA domain-containing protein [Lewinella sp. W8]
MSIKVGIFFGGPSREREISFAGGRTVYDNLDKELFEPVPIFVDSFRRWYLLDWQYLYRGSIRDFFPPVALAPESKHGFQVYQESLGPLDELALEEMGRHVGRRIRREELPTLIDVAFLALHGEYGEDGQLQRELEYAGIPYTGSGVKASEIGMDKALQKELMAARGFAAPAIQVINRGDFSAATAAEYFAAAEKEIGWPMVIRPARQGSSIGVAILEEEAGAEGFTRAVNAAFFREELPLNEYRDRSPYERLEYVRQLSDLRDGLAFPLDARRGEHEITLYTPDDLFDYLEAAAAEGSEEIILFSAHQSEERVIVESFITGKEFSCIVVRTPEGEAVALPPTEIVKSGSELFDYRSKYMPGRSRKVTPIDLPSDRIQAIREECERLFVELGFHVYARIDGFHTPGGGIFLNDPNTTSGMMPSSFFFHQAAEIGLNPSQFLTFIIRTSLRERGMQSELADIANELGSQLDAALDAQRAAASAKERIGVLLGGVSFERHISVESGRNVYEKLSSSEAYRPLPIFLTTPLDSPAAPPPVQTPATDYVLYQLPINLLLKDNADDIRDKLIKSEEHPVIGEIREACASITARYADPEVVFHPQQIAWSNLPATVDGTFIALHGRPGEDGRVQEALEQLGIYYNGSGVESSSLTIDKHNSLQLLRDAGIDTTDQWLASIDDFRKGEAAFYDEVEARFGYPLIAKPVDDGCSSAVKLIKQRDELHAYVHLTFRPDALDEANARREMKLSAKDEWPAGKSTILFEKLIAAEGADKFLEITGGMLTHQGVDGALRYEVFEPSETLAGGEVLSLEEKFLAGEGQNLTPARLATEAYSYDYVAGQVRADLEQIARQLAVEGYCRIDAFVRVFADGRVDTIPIEVNSLPGMTPATAIFHQAALAGYQPAQFIDAILSYGKARRDRAAAPPAPVTAAAGPVSEELPSRQETNLALTSTEETDQPRSEDTPDIPESVTPPPSAVEVTPPVTPVPEPTPVFAAPAVEEEEDEDVHPLVAKLKATGGKVLDFFRAPYVWKNIGGALLFFLLLFVMLRVGMSWYTNHGKSLELPTFEGTQIEEARRMAEDLGLRIDVDKGAFDPDRPAGLVVQQHPRPNSRVKKNRTIYLTILSDEAPMITLPSLVGNYDYDQYVRALRSLGIRAKVRSREYDPKQEENTILHFFYDDQKITDEDLRGGVKVPQGSTLEFVVTIRQTGNVNVPQLKCRRFSEAEFVLGGSGLEIGSVRGTVASRDDAFIVRTEPAAGQSVALGTRLTVFLSDQRPTDCP